MAWCPELEMILPLAVRTVGDSRKGQPLDKALKAKGAFTRGPKESTQRMPEGGTGAGLAAQRGQALWSGEAM